MVGDARSLGNMLLVILVTKNLKRLSESYHTISYPKGYEINGCPRLKGSSRDIVFARENASTN